jgi:hypothetical protein
MVTPAGGWLGLVVKVGQEEKSEDEYEEKIAKRLEELQADGVIWDLLLSYDWRSAKRAAFCPPEYRKMVEHQRLGGTK